MRRSVSFGLMSTESPSSPSRQLPRYPSHQVTKSPSQTHSESVTSDEALSADQCQYPGEMEARLEVRLERELGVRLTFMLLRFEARLAAHRERITCSKITQGRCTMVRRVCRWWLSAVKSRLCQRKKTAQLVNRLYTKSTTNTLVLWRDMVVEDRQMKAKALKVVRRLMSRAMEEGFGRWRDSAVEGSSHQGAQTMDWAAIKSNHQTLIRAWAQWLRYLHRAEYRMEMCKRVMQHMLRHQLLMAWKMFVDCVFETRHTRQTVSKVLSRMQHRQLAGALDLYARAVDMLVVQREKVERMLRRWQAPALKKAWQQWEAYVKYVWQERAQESQELAKQQLEEAARRQQRWGTNKGGEQSPKRKRLLEDQFLLPPPSLELVVEVQAKVVGKTEEREQHMNHGEEKKVEAARLACLDEILASEKEQLFQLASALHVDKDQQLQTQQLQTQQTLMRAWTQWQLEHTVQKRQKDLEETSQKEESLRQRAAEAESTCQKLRQALEEEKRRAHALREESREREREREKEKEESSQRSSSLKLEIASLKQQVASQTAAAAKSEDTSSAAEEAEKRKAEEEVKAAQEREEETAAVRKKEEETAAARKQEEGVVDAARKKKEEEKANKIVHIVVVDLLVHASRSVAEQTAAQEATKLADEQKRKERAREAEQIVHRLLNDLVVQVSWSFAASAQSTGNVLTQPGDTQGQDETLPNLFPDGSDCGPHQDQHGIPRLWAPGDTPRGLRERQQQQFCSRADNVEQEVEAEEEQDESGRDEMDGEFLDKKEAGAKCPDDAIMTIETRQEHLPQWKLDKIEREEERRRMAERIHWFFYYVLDYVGV